MDYAPFITQLESVINDHRALIARSRHDDGSDSIMDTKAYELLTRARAAIQRATGSSSEYMTQLREILAAKAYIQKHLLQIIGVAESLCHDLKAGYLTSLAEIAHADVFADYLDTAHHLWASGYKDAAAVIAGSTLESHLRRLCYKNGIPTDETAPGGATRNKKADTLNADLAKASVYNLIDQKSVVAWLDLRNKAAHGRYDEYKADQVDLLIEGVRSFLSRMPA